MYNIYLLVVYIRVQDNNMADLLSSWTYTEADVSKLYTIIQDPVLMNAHLDLL